MTAADEILASLTSSVADHWFAVASVLVALERLSPSSPDGRSWQEVVAGRLAELDHPLSLAYLRKLRRVRRFLETEMPSLLEGRVPRADDVGSASYLALEVTERLMAIDPEEGRRALADALKGASHAEIVLRLRDVQVRHPERLSARQIGWQRRREAASAPSPLDAVAAILTAAPGTWWGEPDTFPRAFRPGDRIPLLERTPCGFSYHTRDGVLGLGGLRWIERDEKPLWIVESVLVQASFFDRYWLVGSDVQFASFELMLKLREFGARNVGVLRWSGAVLDVVEAIWKPSSGSRREMLVTAVQLAGLGERRKGRKRPRD